MDTGDYKDRNNGSENVLEPGPLTSVSQPSPVTKKPPHTIRLIISLQVLKQTSRNGHCVKVVWFGNDSTHAFQSGLTDLFVARKDGTQMERYRLRKRVLVKGSLAS